MVVSPLRWEASVSTRIPICPSILGYLICGTELRLLQQVPTVGFKSEGCPKRQSDPPSQMQLPDENRYKSN